jgi:proline dehydrogenase
MAVSLMRRMLLAGSQSEWLRQQATRRRFVRSAVSRFMPGETIDDALRAAAALQSERLGTIVTQLGENISDSGEALAVLAHYHGVLDRLPASGLDTEVSVKLTQLGLDLDPALAVANTVELARRSAAIGRRLWIDMESSAYVERTLAAYRQIQAQEQQVGVCLQAYLHRTKADLESLIPLGCAIRMVKGAYQEPPEIAMPRKADVDYNYYRLCGRLLDEDARRAGCHVTIATHDRTLIGRLIADAERRGVPKDGYEFAMLYGIQHAEQVRLAAAGHRMRVLISYGGSWFPWYMRRLAERPANVWFVVRSMVGS